MVIHIDHPIDLKKDTIRYMRRVLIKNLTITLLTLLMSMGAWADDEFPIELTCEVGANIIYLHFNEDEDKSWWRNHFNNSSQTGTKYYENGTDKQKFYSINNIDDLEIRFELGRFSNSTRFRLNRINGKIYSVTGDGQCYKGFKEYEKQI
ncbi:MAG: hypothetical protein ACJ0F4_02230 [Gammaproteobacteria bacterium]